MTSPPCQRLFVFQHTAKRAPALIQNRLVQPRLLVGTWCPGLFAVPRGRPRHMLHLQIFEDDDRVVFADLRRELVQEIVAAIGNAGIESGDATLLLLPVTENICACPPDAVAGGFFSSPTRR